MRTIFKETWIFFLGALLCAPVLSSCSNDDDEDGGVNNDGTEIGIPSSVVDGVRVSGVTTDNSESAISIDYDSDGMVKSATVGGQKFTFEYADDTRSEAAPKRRIKRISSKIESDDYYFYCEATNFKINTDGFVASYLEKVTEKYDGDSEEITANLTFSYNSAGRIERIGGSSTWTAVEDGVPDSGYGGGSVNYVYNGGALEKSGYSYDGYGVEWTYEYDHAHTNTYNVFTSELAYGISMMEDPILYALAFMGYVGNASSLLPTKAVYRAYSNIPDDYDYKYIFDISYTFWDNNRIHTITTDAYDESGYKLYYTVAQYTYL